ncbi:MAG: primosomal protein N' [Oceanicoccus sp.]
MPILRLAMPTPLRRSFDYLPPEDMSADQVARLTPGSRIMAPFGRRQLVGILLSVENHSDIPAAQLKAVVEVLDLQATLTPRLLELCLWAASYYQHPVGDALANAIPALLRKGGGLIDIREKRWRLTTEGKGLPTGALTRAKKQAAALLQLQNNASQGPSDFEPLGINTTVLKTLAKKGLIETFTIEKTPIDLSRVASVGALTLNHEQQQALDSIAIDQQYQCSLLDGVTGSGKTEVYLQLIEKCLQAGRQTLVLIPEIGLTPQTLSRFQQRFNCPIAILHSGLTDRERLLAWQQAKIGEAGIIIGTRSAIFTPTLQLGLIIIDEEHDSSYKQQDGFRYSARDIAIKRAALEHCPILLGSATPSLETLNNAIQGRYQHLQLVTRATGAQQPTFQIVDVRHAPMEDGLSPSLIESINEEIQNGNQVLVFINRRGFSPMLMCHDCGYVAQCQHCDARMTVHFRQQLLRCHHCESQRGLPHSCPDCNSKQLDFRGSGTERSEQALKKRFPDTSIIRIDRDTTSRKHAMENLVADVHKGTPCILVGTQMLAKGHHFPDVTLVAVLDADGGLFSADFRGPEKMGQLLVQVAGRAGRASKPGRVVIQTHQPEHPLINTLTTSSYREYTEQLLPERKISHLPPFGYLAIVRAEAKNTEHPEQFLRDLRSYVEANSVSTTPQMLGPLPAPMARRAGYFRAQLVLRADNRGDLHRTLQLLTGNADQHPLGNKLRWSVDVDPVDMF